MTERIDLSSLDPDPEGRERRIADRVMHAVRVRPAPRRLTLTDEILAARMPAVLTAAAVALLAWAVARPASPLSIEAAPIGVASALGIPAATAHLARREEAPTLRDVLVALGQAP